jgi:hypothetical protein
VGVFDGRWALVIRPTTHSYLLDPSWRLEPKCWERVRTHEVWSLREDAGAQT